ncbi:hypothetical protein Tco_1253786 [Tanacetum coccineum]
MSSEHNNIKLAIRNDKSEIVCAMCKQCLITANHDACVLNYVNGMNSRSKKQKANVSNIANQTKHKAQIRMIVKILKAWWQKVILAFHWLSAKFPVLTSLQTKGKKKIMETMNVEQGASVSVMPLSTYLNLGLGELAHIKLTVELADRTVKYPKGVTENVLVGIGKFTFPVDFIILDMLEDIKVPLILERPFFSTSRAKIDVYKRNITLRVREERIVFTSDKPTSSLIKRVYMLILGEYGSLLMKVMGDVIVGEPFLREVGIKERRFKGTITMYNGDDEVTYQMVRSHLRFKNHTNEQCNKIPPLLKDPITFEMRRWKNGSHVGTLACMRWNDEKLKKSLT